MKYWDKVTEDVLKAIMSNVGWVEPGKGPVSAEALSQAPWLRLSLWADWLQWALSSPEDSLEHVVVLSPAFCEAFAEGCEILEQIESGVFAGTPEERSKEMRRQEARLRHLRACWDRAEVLVGVLSREHEHLFGVWVERKRPASVRVYEGGVVRS